MNSNTLKQLWDVYNIPTYVLISLLLQVILVLFASLRQSTKNSFLHFLIWSAYLSADWIAAITVGIITRALTDSQPSSPRLEERDLYSFWASFLLLHLGGPDTITSYALEDNEFWLRHLLRLVLKSVAAGYCIIQTFTNINNNNLLWIPTILIFVVGIVKYAERTMSLYLASFDKFGDTVPDPEPDEDTKFDMGLVSESLSLDRVDQLLVVSYSLLKSFKPVIFGDNLAYKLVRSSKKLFCRMKDPKVGFKLIELELSFIYEILHTKVEAVCSRTGVVFRLSSFCFIVAAFLLFQFAVDKDQFGGGFEISVTYALLIGAIGIDTVSGIKLLLFSDWILVSNNNMNNAFIKRLMKFIPEFVWKRKRWCDSISKYSMTDYCLAESWLWNHNTSSSYLPDCLRANVADKIKIILYSSPDNDIEIPADEVCAGERRIQIQRADRTWNSTGRRRSGERSKN